MERIFPRQINSLESIFEFTREFIERNQLPDSVAYTLNLAVEEIFTNLVKYDPRGSTGILIDLAKTGYDLTIRLIDSDSNRFDLTKWSGEDIPQTGDREDKVGGLGLLLVRNMVDDVYYNYENRTSTITMIIHLEHDDVEH
jgi:serine/threonine-protein kinase RsbW